VKIVLDTNVLVAGLLSPFGSPGQIVRMVSSGDLMLCLDVRALAEYNEVLRRPEFGLDEADVAAFLDYVAHRAHVVAALPLGARLPDPDDEPFLEIASACEAEYLVTGNRAHFPADACGEIAVVSPAELVAAIRDRGGLRPD
jgi:putative PIN family toxin of toxin-antitoxin system